MTGLDSYGDIYGKLRGFIRKYYTNEIIKGSILFAAFGLLYFLFTLFVEYFLWLRPFARTVLFWTFVLIEVLLFTRFVIIPLFKLLGIKKGIGEQEASRIIGRHFKEVDDKLLNIIQLHENSEDSDLLLASIEQKASALRPIPFTNAIVFKRNLQYLKYLLAPLLIVLLIWLTGNNSVITGSLNRVVHHQTAFMPPAPFRFEILNADLETLEDRSYVLRFNTVGEIVPDEVRIHYKGESYFVKTLEDGTMEYTFQFPQTDIEFYLEGNGVRSDDLFLSVIATPRITDFKMKLDFPAYLNMESEWVSNTGNAEVPEGTEVSWVLAARNAEEMEFVVSGERQPAAGVVLSGRMEQDAKGEFTWTRTVRKDMKYQIMSSNSSLKQFEKLSYELRVIKDEYPGIYVRSDLDSVSRGPVLFAGQLTDDHGLSRLQVVARNSSTKAQSIGNIPIGNSALEEFYYVFPEGIHLEEGASYEIFFEVYDNDRVNGPKKSVSSGFYYRNRTEQELEREVLMEQREGIEEMENVHDDGEELEKQLEEFSKKVKNKEEADWNDRKQIENYLKRQMDYQEMLERNAEKMLDNLDGMEEENQMLEDKKEELRERWKEMEEWKDKEDLLRELQEMTDKLKKEDLIEKMDKLKEQNKQDRRSLERILELTKQFYVERKSAKIMEELKELAEKQLEQSFKENNKSDSQEGLNRKFDSIRRDFEELREQNQGLKEPMELFPSEPDEKLIEMDMKQALEKIEQSESTGEQNGEKAMEEAREKQRNAANRMKELSKKIESGMLAMEAQGTEENIEDLQQILKNLIRFSLDQEELMHEFTDISSESAAYPGLLKEQIKLKEHFEHIDDSLYALSLRMVKLSSDIQKDLSDVHFNLDKSLEHITENRITQGRSNQQYTMTAANNLADMLSNMLESLQNQRPGMGQGSGKGEELSLPDIIKEQQGMMKSMQQGMEKQRIDGERGQEEMSGEQFRMYQEQRMLREKMEELLRQNGSDSDKGKQVLDQMESLERILLEKGITQETLQRMQRLEHELLEMENAGYENNKEKRRRSETGIDRNQKRLIQKLEEIKGSGAEDELLRRNRIPMSPDYQRRVKDYFNNSTKE